MRAVSVRQWTTVYLHGIRGIPEEQWYQAHMQCSISPLFKRIGGKVCADL